MGLLFGATLALITLANRYMGDSGVYAVAAVSGISDVDAIILSLSSLAKNGLSSTTAYYAILIAILSIPLPKWPWSSFWELCPCFVLSSSTMSSL